MFKLIIGVGVGVGVRVGIRVGERGAIVGRGRVIPVRVEQHLRLGERRARQQHRRQHQRHHLDITNELLNNNYILFIYIFFCLLRTRHALDHNLT